MARFDDVLRRNPCAYCGTSGGVLDHIVPRHRNGKDGGNLTGACARCNTSKGKSSLLAFLGRRHLEREHAEVLAQRLAWPRVGA